MGEGEGGWAVLCIVLAAYWPPAPSSRPRAPHTSFSAALLLGLHLLIGHVGEREAHDAHLGADLTHDRRDVEEIHAERGDSGEPRERRRRYEAQLPDKRLHHQ